MNNDFIKIPNISGFTMVKKPTIKFSTTTPKKDKKLNLKVKTDDLLMIDGMASLLGLTRTQILEMMVSDILLDELLQIEQLDARLLLAETADNLLSHNNSKSMPWAHKAFQSEINKMFWCIRNMNDVQEQQESWNSDLYKLMQQKLEEGLKHG